MKKRLHHQFVLLYEQGYRKFWIGGTLGVDIWAGEILLRMKEQPEYQGIELSMVLPFEGHDTNWDQRNRQRIDFLKRHCTEVKVAGIKDQAPAENYWQQRMLLIEDVDCLVAVYDNDRTVKNEVGIIVKRAEQNEIEAVLIHPDTGMVEKIG